MQILVYAGVWKFSQKITGEMSALILLSKRCNRGNYKYIFFWKML
jgi:hypothetical protein